MVLGGSSSSSSSSKTLDRFMHVIVHVCDQRNGVQLMQLYAKMA
jgi:hypothetical protein